MTKEKPLSDKLKKLNNILTPDDVEWVVNDNCELGVKIGNRFFFLYKGHSLEYEDGLHDDGSKMMWRYVGKREFGECCHPWQSIEKESGKRILPESYVGFYREEKDPNFDNPWRPLA